MGLLVFLPPGPGVTVTAGPYDYIFAALFDGWVIVQLVVGPTLFRQGKKWGWYVILIAWLITLVASILGSIKPESTVAGTFDILLFFYGPATLALLLTYRKFFPKKLMAAS